MDSDNNNGLFLFLFSEMISLFMHFHLNFYIAFHQYFKSSEDQIKNTRSLFQKEKKKKKKRTQDQTII